MNKKLIIAFGMATLMVGGAFAYPHHGCTADRIMDGVHGLITIIITAMADTGGRRDATSGRDSSVG